MKRKSYIRKCKLYIIVIAIVIDISIIESVKKFRTHQLGINIKLVKLSYMLKMVKYGSFTVWSSHRQIVNIYTSFFSKYIIEFSKTIYKPKILTGITNKC